MSVRYTRQALADRAEAQHYVALDRPAAAVAIATRIRSAIVVSAFRHIGDSLFRTHG